jgi:hypothetical protein
LFSSSSSSSSSPVSSDPSDLLATSFTLQNIELPPSLFRDFIRVFEIEKIPDR